MLNYSNNFILKYYCHIGYRVDNLQFIRDKEICQKACNFNDDCDFFLYDKVQQNCELIHGQEVKCDLMIGPPDPLIRSCENFTEIVTTTTTTSTMTTSTTTTSSTTSTTLTTPITNNYISIRLIDDVSKKALKNATVSAIYQSDKTDMTTNADGMHNISGGTGIRISAVSWRNGLKASQTRPFFIFYCIFCHI